MSDDATKRDERPQETGESELTPKQSTVLADLLQGHSVADAAKAAGVDRSTIYRWLHGVPEFRAEYNRQRCDLCESVRSQLMRLADKAVSVVQKTLEAGDVRVALSVLKGLGALSGKPIGYVGADAEEIEAALEVYRDWQAVWDKRNTSEESNGESGV